MGWANAPAGTQSFFLNMHDMDLARNKTTDDQAHWVLWNIPATTTGLPEGVPKGSELPDGSYQISATGPMYRGPGAGANGPFHHYVFELYALDTKLDVRPSADAFETRANVIKAIQGHILAKAVYGGAVCARKPVVLERCRYCRLQVERFLAGLRMISLDPHVIDETGHIYRALEVLKYAGNDGSGARWLCACTCGQAIDAQ
jgi:Raf kinase inhibitor-like YbhB/YbcL family protein